MINFTRLPLASPGLTSYRYRGPYGYVMIGARDDADALAQAGRSLSYGSSVSMEKLEIWSGETYVPVKP